MKSWTCAACHIKQLDDLCLGVRFGDKRICSSCDTRGRIWAAKSQESPPVMGWVMGVATVSIVLSVLFAPEQVRALVAFLVRPWTEGG